MNTNIVNSTEFEKAFDNAKPGDLLTISSFAAIVWNTEQAFKILDKAFAKNISILSIEDNLDTRLLNDATFLMLSAMVTTIRKNQRIQQKQGIDKAVAENRYGESSRLQRIVQSPKFQILKNKIEHHEITKQEASQELGISRPSLDKYLKNTSK